MRELTGWQWFLIVAILYPLAVVLYLRDCVRNVRRREG